ncbi:hypothetical protein [Okeania sp.]|uniref:hypothetical protein n=1 Tax=Okeania sp. TaxID=3100323 RepID=UPI002B4AF222|nr:hypothetical protein [Okeania sp.]MEB3341352.1 hypothetical protein [Okeania sp.]
MDGQSKISEDGCVEVAPELIVEIAASIPSIDLHQKLKTYQNNQFQKSLIRRLYDI